MSRELLHKYLGHYGKGAIDLLAPLNSRRAFWENRLSYHIQVRSYCRVSGPLEFVTSNVCYNELESYDECKYFITFLDVLFILQ